MTIKVVNINYYQGDDVAYIGRGSPLGNPYTSKKSKLAKYKVDTVEEAVTAYKTYLLAKIRAKDKIILNELKLMLDYYTQNGTIALGCFCKGKNGENHLCHGDIIKEIMMQSLKHRAKGK